LVWEILISNYLYIIVYWYKCVRVTLGSFKSWFIPYMSEFWNIPITRIGNQYIIGYSFEIIYLFILSSEVWKICEKYMNICITWNIGIHTRYWYLILIIYIYSFNWRDGGEKEKGKSWKAFNEYGEAWGGGAGERESVEERG